jgi:peptidoglycan/LPS O-acetylase OafA/YrhL
MFSFRRWQRVFDNRLFLFMSVISYNLYLYHLVISMSLLYRIHFPHATTAVPQMDHHWQLAFIIVAALASVAVASLATYLIERPLLHNGRQMLISALPKARKYLSLFGIWTLKDRPRPSPG